MSMNPKTTAILAKSPYSSVQEWRETAENISEKTKGMNMSDKCPTWEEMAKSRGQTVARAFGKEACGVGGSIPKEAVRMGATVTLKHSPEENAVVEADSADIQTRLEILKILFSSPYIGPDHGFTTKQVENWVKTGEGVGIVFVEWSK